MKGNSVLHTLRTTIAALAVLATPLVLAHPTTEWNDPTQVGAGTPKPSAPREKKEAPDKAKAAAQPPRAASR